MFKNWITNRRKKKAITQQKELLRKMVNELKQLYRFVKWLNGTALVSRPARRQFWESVSKGKTLAEDTIENLINQYEKRL